MNEITTANKMLPETVEEVADFVVVNEEKLNAVKAAIRAAKKAGSINLEELERQQRELEITTVMAQCRLGELTKGMEKAQGTRSDITSSDTRTKFETKESALQDIGLTKQRASEYERMSAHPEAVKRVIDSGGHVTKSAVLKEIQKPHVVNNSKDDEWYTPSQYIESARSVMGSIDLDPASNDFANETVKATTYYTEADNGLKKEWFGNVWLNPPYSTSLVQSFIDKVVSSNFSQAIILVNNATETAWFGKLISKASAIVFHKGRIRFVKRDGEHGTPLQGQAFIYYGNNPQRFLEVFSKFGWGAKL